MQDKDCDPDRPFFNRLLGGGGETLPCPIISEDFSTIVAALDRTSKGFSEGSALYVVDACTEIIESVSAAVVPRITDIPANTNNIKLNSQNWISFTSVLDFWMNFDLC